MPTADTGGAVELPALGTYLQLRLSRPDDQEIAAKLATQFIAEVDAAASRFRPDSELSLVNQASGKWVPVSDLFISALKTAVLVAAETQGLVDPLLGRALVALGYDRDFQQLKPQPGKVSLPGSYRQFAWREIEIDEAAGAVKIPKGLGLDLGATGKAWAADLLAEILANRIGNSGLVNLGGDIATFGTAGNWPVSVQENRHSATQQQVWLQSGGLATSSNQVRRWTQAGVVRHHLLNPSTGLPVADTWNLVSTLGVTCTAANAASTAAMVLGAGATTWLTQQQVAARLVSAAGAVTYLGQWPKSGSNSEGQ